MLRRNNGEEVVYTELTNDGNGIPQKGISSLRNPKWRQPTNNILCKKAFRATRRKYFKNKGERTSWLKAEKAVLPLDVHGKARYPTEWVEAMIELARSANIEYQTACDKSCKNSFPCALVGNSQ